MSFLNSTMTTNLNTGPDSSYSSVNSMDCIQFLMPDVAVTLASLKTLTVDKDPTDGICAQVWAATIHWTLPS